jgi:transcriptional regulator with XRE-family HTH domain
MTKDSSSGAIAQILRQQLDDQGLSLYELAKRIGLERSTLMRIADGTTTQPNVETLEAIARGLDIEAELFYDALWQDTGQPLPSAPIYLRSQYSLSDEQIAAVERSIEQQLDHDTKSTHDERRSP